MDSGRPPVSPVRPSRASSPPRSPGGLRRMSSAATSQASSRSSICFRLESGDNIQLAAQGGGNGSRSGQCSRSSSSSQRRLEVETDANRNDHENRVKNTQRHQEHNRGRGGSDDSDSDGKGGVKRGAGRGRRPNRRLVESSTSSSSSDEGDAGGAGHAAGSAGARVASTDKESPVEEAARGGMAARGESPNPRRSPPVPPPPQPPVVPAAASPAPSPTPDDIQAPTPVTFAPPIHVVSAALELSIERDPTTSDERSSPLFVPVAQPAPSGPFQEEAATTPTWEVEDGPPPAQQHQNFSPHQSDAADDQQNVSQQQHCHQQQQDDDDCSSEGLPFSSNPMQQTVASRRRRVPMVVSLPEPSPRRRSPQQRHVLPNASGNSHSHGQNHNRPRPVKAVRQCSRATMTTPTISDSLPARGAAGNGHGAAAGVGDRGRAKSSSYAALYDHRRRGGTGRATSPSAAATASTQKRRPVPPPPDDTPFPYLLRERYLEEDQPRAPVSHAGCAGHAHQLFGPQPSAELLAKLRDIDAIVAAHQPHHHSQSSRGVSADAPDVACGGGGGATTETLPTTSLNPPARAAGVMAADAGPASTSTPREEETTHLKSTPQKDAPLSSTATLSPAPKRQDASKIPRARSTIVNTLLSPQKGNAQDTKIDANNTSASREVAAAKAAVRAALEATQFLAAAAAAASSEITVSSSRMAIPAAAALGGRSSLPRGSSKFSAGVRSQSPEKNPGSGKGGPRAAAAAAQRAQIAAMQELVAFHTQTLRRHQQALQLAGDKATKDGVEKDVHNTDTLKASFETTSPLPVPPTPDYQEEHEPEQPEHHQSAGKDESSLHLRDDSEGAAVPREVGASYHTESDRACLTSGGSLVESDPHPQQHAPVPVPPTLMIKSMDL